MSISTSRRSQAGVALLTAMIIVIVVGGMAVAFLTLSFSQATTISNGSEREVALHIAEAGIEDSLNKLTAYSYDYIAAGNTNPTYPFGSYTSTPDHSVISQNLPIVTGTVNEGIFSAAITRPGGATPVYAGPFLASGYLITSKGTKNKTTRTIETVVGAVDLTSKFKYGLFGDVEVDALGTFFSDGFNSKKPDGTYNAYAATTSYTLPNGSTVMGANATGSLGSNGNIVTNGSVVVLGNATPGPAGTSGPGGQILGSTAPAIAPEPLDPVTYPSTFPAGTLTSIPWINGASATTPIGVTGGTSTYHISSFGGGGQKGNLQVNGNVTIYVDGTFDMNAQMNLQIADGAKLTIYQGPGANDFTINGQSQLGNASAERLQIYSATTGTIKFNGGSSVYAAVYAPQSNFINNGGNEFYGAMVAKTMKLSGNASFHYDENLAKLSTPKPTFKILAWSEIPNK